VGREASLGSTRGTENKPEKAGTLRQTKPTTLGVKRASRTEEAPVQSLDYIFRLFQDVLSHHFGGQQQNRTQAHLMTVFVNGYQSTPPTELLAMRKELLRDQLLPLLSRHIDSGSDWAERAAGLQCLDPGDELLLFDLAASANSLYRQRAHSSSFSKNFFACLKAKASLALISDSAPLAAVVQHAADAYFLAKPLPNQCFWDWLVARGVAAAFIESLSLFIPYRSKRSKDGVSAAALKHYPLVKKALLTSRRIDCPVAELILANPALFNHDDVFAAFSPMQSDTQLQLATLLDSTV
jgi:hypothetical protein